MSEPTVFSYDKADYRRPHIGTTAADQVELPFGVGTFSIAKHEREVCILRRTSSEILDEMSTLKIFGLIEELRKFPFRAIVCDAADGLPIEIRNLAERAAAAGVPFLVRNGTDATELTVERILHHIADRIERGRE